MILVPKHVVFNNTGWLSNSLVGTVKSEEVISAITGIYEASGGSGVKVSRLSGMKVLVSFQDLGGGQIIYGQVSSELHLGIFVSG